MNDDDNFVATYQALRPGIERHFRRTHDRFTAEELTDETFARAWQSWPTYDPSRGSPGQWIFGIARHVRAQHLRGAHRVSVGAERMAVETHEGAVIDRLDAAIALGAMGAAIAGLSAADVEVIGPVIVASLGGLELARRTNAEHLRLHRIRRRLRTVMDGRESAQS